MTDTAIQRAENTASVPPKIPSIDPNNGDPQTPPTRNASYTEKDESTSDEKTQEKGVKSPADVRRKFFLNLMRTVPHPVAVITARKQDVEDDIHGTVAATVSSFNTVSLDPDLIVSFNLKADSITYRTIVDSKHFTVTFPQMTPAGANLVHSFTRGNNPSPFTVDHPDHPTPKPFQWTTEQSEALRNLRYHPPTVALAELHDVDHSGFAFAFVCEYQTSTPVGDHVIVSGRLSPTLIKTAHSGWGEDSGQGPFSALNITLAHAHGMYSSADKGFGLTNIFRLDESLHKARKTHWQSFQRVDWCRRRLKILAYAQLVQKGAHLEDETDRSIRPLIHTIRRIAKMKPELLQGYERYYMQRLQYWEQKLRSEAKQKQASDPDETKTDPGEAQHKSYKDLRGHEQLFVRNKMLLSQDDLDEEILLYQIRLSKLEVQVQEDPAAQAFEEDSELTDEHTPEETESDPNAATEEDGVLRNTQLRDYFQQRIHLLRHAKIRKTDFSAIEEPVKDKEGARNKADLVRRFMGAHKTESLSGLKTKYRRYQYQISEAHLSLIGLEQLPQGHELIRVLKDRIEYFTPRMQAIEGLIKARAQSTTAKDLLTDSFKPPTMRVPDEDEQPTKAKKTRKMPGGLEKGHARGRKLTRATYDKNPVRAVITQLDSEMKARVGESVDQLDNTAEAQLEREELTRMAIKKAATRFPVARPPNVSPRIPLSDRLEEVSPEEQELNELRQMEDIERDLMRRNANEVRDYLVLRDPEDEDIPSPDDFVDVKKLREERLRKKEEKKGHQGTAS